MKRILFCILLLLLLLPTFVIAYSPWLPDDHKIILNAAITDEFADQFFQAKNLTPLPSTINIITEYLGLDFGVTNYLAVDVLTGYTHASFPGATRGNFEGLSDSYLGVRVRLLNEFEQKSPWAPTITVRVGVIFPGTYQISSTLPDTPPNLHSPGDGLFSGELALLVGKQLPKGFAVAGEFGYRFRESPGPSEILGAGALFYTIKNRVILNVQLRTSNDLSGLDIGVPPFNGTPRDFQSLREVKTYAAGGIGFKDPKGNYVGFEYAHVILQGRNTKDSTILGLFFSIPLN